MADHKIYGAKIERETERAILVSFPTNTEGIWVPKSQVRAGTEAKAEGEEGLVIIAGWLAEKEGLTDGQADGPPARTKTAAPYSEEPPPSDRGSGNDECPPF